jgi:NAD(P)-dependent dehydrogenase (short-subunit alcohol dehydrogenase family)
MQSTHQSAASRGAIAGKVALVTGGTSGIGRATAELFVAEGARVVITGQSEERVAAARASLPQDVLVVRSDARSPADAARLRELIEARHGGLDVVFLNAGIAQLAPFESSDEALYDSHMETNVKGVVFTLQRLLPILRPGASVIVNSSLAALRAAPNMALYAASKGAVSALVRTLAVELAPRGIRVNTLSPAMIHTPIQGKFGLPPAMLEAALSEAQKRIPLGRFGDASEVAAVALFLAGAGASFVTGQELAVDGGLQVA